MERRLVIGLNIALTALSGCEPHVLCVRREGGWGLPFGRFDPESHRTFELAMRDFVERQTAVPLGYVEQLYTFGDRGREAPRASLESGDEGDRIVSVGYLALSPQTAPPALERAAWRPWYEFFPWEDQREVLSQAGTELPVQLAEWAGTDPGRQRRVDLAFGIGGEAWEEERALDRYELMYEARLVAEAWRDRGAKRDLPYGTPMISDHRRILATAIGRLRGKMRYRPVVFELVPHAFTLRMLQSSVEAILGFAIHKQNFRRSIETAGLVEKTGGTSLSTGGRPAALYRAAALTDAKTASGLNLPRLRKGEE
jgi:hypothetical protein